MRKFFSKSSRNQPVIDENERREPEVNTQEPVNPIMAGDHQDEIDGVEIREYARRHDLELGSVWSQIRQGSLAARTENGFVYVYGHQLPKSSALTLLDQEDPAPLAGASPDLEPDTKTQTQAIMHELATLVPQEVGEDLVVLSQNQVFMKLVEQLSQARQEARTLALSSQESIARIASISEAAVRAKDDLLQEKEKEIQRARTELEQANADAMRLKQSVEDLEMLVKALQS